MLNGCCHANLTYISFGYNLRPAFTDDDRANGELRADQYLGSRNIDARKRGKNEGEKRSAKKLTMIGCETMYEPMGIYRALFLTAATAATRERPKESSFTPSPIIAN